MSQNKHVWYRADNTVGKITKKQSEGVRFVNSALKIQCHVVKKNNPTDCFFGDFAHWEVKLNSIS